MHPLTSTSTGTHNKKRLPTMTSFRDAPNQTGPTSSVPKPGGGDKQVGRYAEMKDEIARIQATATSADKAVTVVAGPAGAVLDIRLSEQALKPGSARTLSGSIMSTLRIAVADAARQQAAVVQQYVGDRLNILDRVMSTQQELLGDKIEAGEREEQRLAEQSRTVPEEEGGSVLRSVRERSAPQPGVERARPPVEDHEDDDYDPFAWR
jgi:DNA-binding protein YbaB